MTAPILTHADRALWGESLPFAAWYRDGDSTTKRGYASTIPGQLWERIAEGKTR